MNGTRHFGLHRSDRHEALDASYPSDQHTAESCRSERIANRVTLAIFVGVLIALVLGLL